MPKKMWSFQTKHFKVIWEIEPDDPDTRWMEPSLAKEVKQKVRSGEWKCFMSTIKVLDRVTKTELGAAYLGNSIYANPAEFRDHLGMNARRHGSYFSDMVREAIQEARKCLPALQQKLKGEIRKKQQLLNVHLRTG